ncbi:N-acetyltransferase 9-like protein [Syncephalis plumigaleata]|nr:N-acetyltransferase 9-like protein [Syncephalis plumigaleata]
MRQNENLVLKGQRVILVPYRPEHVPRYHEWMQSPVLQEATASEPLTLEQEYAMQTSWREDNDKCTFILLSSQSSNTTTTVEEADWPRDAPMIGDVNLFINDIDDPHCAEIEIMIAEPAYRRGGVATEALQLMMHYGYTTLGLRKYVAKIGMDNEASIRLFKEKLGYEQTSVSQVFREITFTLSITDAIKASLDLVWQQTQQYTYDN